MKALPHIVVRLQGGLGNQMFQYAAGRALSEKFNAVLALDISEYEQDKLRTYELDRMRVQCQLVGSESRDKYTRRESLLRRLTTRILGSGSRHDYYRETGFTYNSSFKELRPSVYLDGYWQSERYFLDIADRLRQEFVSRSPLNAANAIFLERIHSNANPVSLHVRRGDYVSNPVVASFHGVCALDYYHRAVDYVSRTVAKPHFFMFSDDPIWVRENLRIEHPCTVVDGNAADGVAEMALMRACSHHIIANSSFSWWGAWLGENPDRIVVAPKDWFKNPDQDIRDLLPPGWARL